MKKQCDSCGTCCRNGGPPLHTQDIVLVSKEVLSFTDLVTVRRGEMVLPPMATDPVTAETEWIKVQGHGGDWCCRFLDMTTNTCTIYQDRPVSCRALKCWDTKDILELTGRDLLCREDLIAEDDPLLSMVQMHEEEVPVPDLTKISRGRADNDKQEEILQEMTNLVQRDLQLRSKAVQEFKLSVASELFYFGRPLFQLLSPLGFEAVESYQGVELKFHSR